MKKSILEGSFGNITAKEANNRNLLFKESIDDVAIVFTFCVQVGDVARIRKCSRFRGNDSFQRLPVLERFDGVSILITRKVFEGEIRLKFGDCFNDGVTNRIVGNGSVDCSRRKDFMWHYFLGVFKVVYFCDKHFLDRLKFF
jgi:hypothetical protein